MAKYSNIIFHASIVIENATKTILNEVPSKENVRGGGNNIYNHELIENHIIVGINAYAKVNKND